MHSRMTCIMKSFENVCSYGTRFVLVMDLSMMAGC